MVSTYELVMTKVGSSVILVGRLEAGRSLVCDPLHGSINHWLGGRWRGHWGLIHLDTSEQLKDLPLSLL